MSGRREMDANGTFFWQRLLMLLPLTVAMPLFI
jgi:hypothetical protein